MNSVRKIQTDAIIIGGGIAALWTAAILKAKGRSVVLLSNSPLGQGQTLAAQGVIHGGLKYAVGGKLNDSSEELAAMPSRWGECLAGNGEVDLRSVPLLSEFQYLWSLPGFWSKSLVGLGSKAMRNRAQPLERKDYPEVLQNEAYTGKVFRIGEVVFDCVELVRCLSHLLEDCAYLVDWDENAELIPDPEKGVREIAVNDCDGEAISLQAKSYIFAAGSGNENLLKKIGRSSPAMQLRPLHQLVIRSEKLPDFYSVCMGRSTKPPFVSTTHIDSAGRKLWYIGGDLAEQKGVERNEVEQIEAGQALLHKLLPWLDLGDADWFTLRAERAEPFTGSGDRPPGAFCSLTGNVITCWPTKLALAPNLGDQVCEIVEKEHSSVLAGRESITLNLEHPGVGVAPWDRP